MLTLILKIFFPWDGKNGHCFFQYYTSLETKIPEKRAQMSSPVASIEFLGMIMARLKPITKARVIDGPNLGQVPTLGSIDIQGN